MHPCGQATFSSQNPGANQKASSLPFPLVEKEGTAILVVKPRKLLRVKFRTCIPRAHRELLMGDHICLLRPCYEARRVIPCRAQTACDVLEAA